MAREKNKPQGNKSLGRSQVCGEVPVPQRKAIPQDRLQLWQKKGGGRKDPLSPGTYNSGHPFCKSKYGLSSLKLIIPTLRKITVLTKQKRKLICKLKMWKVGPAYRQTVFLRPIWEDTSLSSSLAGITKGNKRH